MTSDAEGPVDPTTLANRDEIATLAGQVAETLGATGFVVCSAIRGTDKTRLVPLFDGPIVGPAPWVRAITMPHAEGFARMLMGSRLPAVWPAYPSQGRWLRTISAPDGPPSGVAFPVSTEHGREGAIAFCNPDLPIAAETLMVVHADCHAIFAAACALRPQKNPRAPAMSGREIDCLRLTSRGLTSDQIAAQLGLSVHTANRYLSNTVQKLDASNRMHAVAKALRAGIID